MTVITNLVIPKRSRYRRLLQAMLGIALLVATLLRFVGLGFGRGVLCPRPDEELIRSGVLISLTGDLNPHYAVWGHLFHYLYAAISAAWTAIRVWSGSARNWTEAVAATHCDPGTFIWLGRALSATAGVLTLAATYQLARRALGSRLVAAGSCILLSTLFLHVRDSHFATCDMLLTLLSTCALAAMASAGRMRAGHAAVWTGLALATKLLAATVVLTFLTVSVGCRPTQPEERRWSHRLGEIVRFLAVAAAVTIVTQPFLLLDPMETWYGLFDDLFNPGRRPFEHGLHAVNAAILVRYYVPQALGWVVGGLATVGGLFLVVQVVSERLRCRHRASLLAYVLWSILALVSVERIFLRYLDPLLPVTCVLAAFGIERICRTTARFLMRVHCRVGLTLACTLLAALPNLYRGIWLDHHLLQPDTRELARQWIEQNVPSGSRILWASHGVLAPHLTMPWLHTPEEYDRQHIALRLSRNLPTNIDETIIEWKKQHQVPTYWSVGLNLHPEQPTQSGLAAYPMLDHDYPIAILKWIDRRSRKAGLLRRESPRWEIMRRHVTEVIQTSPHSLVNRRESYVVITGMPCDPMVLDALKSEYEQVNEVDPGVPWAEYAGRVMYDLGDVWYLPNLGVHRVVRPGPEIRIFRLRSAGQPVL